MHYRLKANGSVLIFEGFLKVNPQALQDKKLPDFAVSDKLQAENILAEKHETPPPPRYNDASLIKTLEEKDIGRPSTYATIISTIEGRRYIEKQEAKFIPTPIGVAVNDFLVENFADVDDIPFTAEMENELDGIANGEKEWVPMIRKFYTPFEKKLEDAKGSERVKIEVEKTDEKCEKCRAPMVIRIGKYGKFLSCSTFPKCSFSKAFIQETGLTCSKCNPSANSGQGGKIIVRKTRKGRQFYGCSNYPACKFAVWKLEDIKKDSNPSLSLRSRLSREKQSL
ncbi:MAG: DNA topoisomerase [bacterium]|nr:DNA topoisomerase [bacterium]